MAELVAAAGMADERVEEWMVESAGDEVVAAETVDAMVAI